MWCVPRPMEAGSITHFVGVLNDLSEIREAPNCLNQINNSIAASASCPSRA